MKSAKKYTLKKIFLVPSKKLDFLHNIIYPKNHKHIQKILTTFFRTCEIFKNLNFSIIWNGRHFRKKQFLKIPIFFFSSSKILNLSENANSWKSDMFSNIRNFSQYQIFFRKSYCFFKWIFISKFVKFVLKFETLTFL